jgi:hypothetical protein
MPIPSMLSVKSREPLTVHIEHASVAEHWTDIQDHKWFLSERLGRDVGTRVAALDYFENIHQADPGPGIMRRLKLYATQFICLLVTGPKGESPASIVNFERVMHGTRSLAK